MNITINFYSERNNSPSRPGRSFLIVLSQDKEVSSDSSCFCDGSSPNAAFHVSSCVIQILSCGRKWASRDSWVWKRQATSRCFPVGFCMEPLFLAQKQSYFLRDLLWVLLLLASWRFRCKADRVRKVSHSLKEGFCQSRSIFKSEITFLTYAGKWLG